MYKSFLYGTIFSLLFSLFFTGCFFNKKKHRAKTPMAIVQDTNVTKKALIVGVGNYVKDNKDLPGIEIDVKKMKNLFTTWGFQTAILEKPLEFEKTLLSYADLGKDDVFILYYTGHGSYTKDYSGDESDDGKDELIVLSDGSRNLFLLDDKIDNYLDNIKARKLIIFDSCNSGTSTRALGDGKTKVKYIQAPPFAGDKYLPANSLVAKNSKSGASLFFAACKDNEQSLSSANGSLFTSTFLSKVNINQSASWIQEQTLESVKQHFHPVLTSSDENLKNIRLRDYLKLAN